LSIFGQPFGGPNPGQTRVPLLTNPQQCSEPLSAAGCDQLSLKSFALNVPQRNEPDGLATPNVKNVKLTLPLGTVINPSAAVGLRACSDAQFALHSGERGACPHEAQVDKVRVKSSALEEALEGQVYLAAAAVQLVEADAGRRSASGAGQPAHM
jgi:hypothetical protein